MLDVSILLTREETPGATFEAGLTFFSTPFPSLQREHENNLIRYSRARDARLPLTRDRVDETRWVAERRERDCNCACTRKRSFITRSFFSSMARGLAVDSGTRLECDFQLNWMISDLDFSFLLVPFFFFFLFGEKIRVEREFVEWVLGSWESFFLSWNKERFLRYICAAVLRDYYF